MTEEDIAFRNHLMVRNTGGKMLELYRQRGVLPIDAAIGALYAAFDAAEGFQAGDRHGAIEWMRTALDLMERQLIEEAQPE